MKLFVKIILFKLVIIVIINKICIMAFDGHVSIKSKYDQLVTSSTLKWIHHMPGVLETTLPSDSVPSGTGNSRRIICFAEKNGLLILGHTTDNHTACIIGFVNRIYLESDFYVLVNKDNAGKLKWVSFNTFSRVPIGTVAGITMTNQPTTFIGRFLASSTSRWQPGSIETRIGSGFYFFGIMNIWESNGVMQKVSHGDVLVEEEPVHYELQIDPVSEQQSRRTKQRMENIVLETTSLFRFNEGLKKKELLKKAITYNYKISDYFGQIRGTIRGLPTTIYFANSQSLIRLSWGLPKVTHRSYTATAEFGLHPDSAVNVSVVAISLLKEEPYSGILTSIFADGTRRSRNINGVSQYRRINKISLEYSHVYRINNSKTNQSEISKSVFQKSNENKETTSKHSIKSLNLTLLYINSSTLYSTGVSSTSTILNVFHSEPLMVICFYMYIY